MKRDGFHTITLGCKLNQFDTAGIEGELSRRGLVAEADPARAAVVILNTCTVTHRADSDARKLIRRIRRGNPGCRLLVTGCYAESDARAIAEVGGVDRVFGNRDKLRLPEILDELGIHGTAPEPAAPDRYRGDHGCESADGLPRAVHFGERSRAFLKVQDGCRLVCSYCIIPAVRGPSRSVPVERLESAVASLARGGFREIVLTGINTGDYGRDLDRAVSLESLLRRLLDRPEPVRYRLNSLEPLTLTDAVIELMADNPRLAPHVQVPLQSGSDATLRAMRRNYRFAQWQERVERLRERVPHAAIGADVIVGFPGESDERFLETHDRIAASPLNYLHVFSWSARRGTHAASLPGRLSESVIGERSAALRTLGDERARAFRRRFVGRTLDAVVLAPDRGGRTRGLTGNYIEVEIVRGATREREIAEIRVLSAEGDSVRAEATGVPEWLPAPAPGTDAGRPFHLLA
jgi:threonylcarbamoyladenosine tRNA methylthiotransferase MtaB